MFQNNQEYKKKYGVILLAISIVFFIVSTFGLAIFSMARGCGYARGFMSCLGLSHLAPLFAVVGAIIFILALVQLFRPFFGIKMVKIISIVYLGMTLTIFVFGITSMNLESTEKECAIVGLFDSDESQYCYYKLGMEKDNLSICDKAVKYKIGCVTYVAIVRGDYSLCPSGEEYYSCIDTIAKRKLDLEGCNRIQGQGAINSCMTYIQERTK